MYLHFIQLCGELLVVQLGNNRAAWMCRYSIRADTC